MVRVQEKKLRDSAWIFRNLNTAGDGTVVPLRELAFIVVQVPWFLGKLSASARQRRQASNSASSRLGTLDESAEHIHYRDWIFALGTSPSDDV